MHFSIDKSLEILERTPETLANLVDGLSTDWTFNNEGAGTWSVYDVMGHLIHGEKTDWLIRIELILSDDAEKKFEPFDRFAQFETSKGKSMAQLLEEFRQVRMANIEKLRKLDIGHDELIRTGIHPSFGKVTLSQLVSAWVVHDLDHIAQIARVMAKQYKEEVGPWVEYLKILRW